MLTPQFLLPINRELVIDLFAGGGGASTGIEQAIGRAVDIAINHDAEAVSLHQANHPQTMHYCSDVFEVDPMAVTHGRPVGMLWASPDCKHFSKAKGGKPVSKKIRSLAWVVVKWAKIVRPRMIFLENVEEFQTWGPLGADNRPCPNRKGQTFALWKKQLQNLGYQIEHRELRACDYGAPTIRKRLFLVARCDGMPIVWPQPTHFDPRLEDKRHRERGEHRRPAWRTAAECIDWSIPAPSIFERKKDLADATCRRIAKGIMRYVVNAAEPFIVGVGGRAGQSPERPMGKPLGTITSKNDVALCVPTLINTANSKTTGRGPNAWDINDPVRTVTSAPGFALVSAFLAKHYTGVTGSDLADPMGTVTSVDHHSLVTATLIDAAHGEVSPSGVKRWGEGHKDIKSPAATVTASGGNTALVTANLVHYHADKRAADVRASDLREPIKTQTTENRHALVTSNLIKLRGTNVGSATDEPLHTISAQGTHHAEVRAFLIKYYGTDQDPRLTEPMHTVPTKDRFGLVTVHGEEYQIVDIGLRMLTPRELYMAQGFPASYQIDFGADGRPLTKTAQVRMCGNSVSPPCAFAIVSANYAELETERMVA